MKKSKIRALFRSGKARQTECRGGEKNADPGADAIVDGADGKKRRDEKKRRAQKIASNAARLQKLRDQSAALLSVRRKMLENIGGNCFFARAAECGNICLRCVDHMPKAEFFSESGKFARAICRDEKKSAFLRKKKQIALLQFFVDGKPKKDGRHGLSCDSDGCGVL